MFQTTNRMGYNRFWLSEPIILGMMDLWLAIRDIYIYIYIINIYIYIYIYVCMYGISWNLAVAKVSGGPSRGSKLLSSSPCNGSANRFYRKPVHLLWMYIEIVIVHRVTTYHIYILYSWYFDPLGGIYIFIDTHSRTTLALIRLPLHASQFSTRLRMSRIITPGKSMVHMDDLMGK